MKRIIFTLLLLTLIINKSNAQTPSWIWAKSGICNTDVYNNVVSNVDVCTDNNDNVITIGNFIGDSIMFGSTILYNQGDQDGFIAKYNSSGDLLWVNNIGGDGREYIYHVLTDSNNNIYVAGLFESVNLTIDTITIQNAGNKDGFVIKYDSSGQVLWVKQISGYADELISDVKIDLNGDILVSGSYNDSILIIDTSIIYNQGYNAYFFLKFDENGNNISVNSNEWMVGSIGIDNVGNYYFSGGFTGSVSLESVSLVSEGGFDRFIAKFDSDLNLIWCKSFGGVDNEYGGIIKIDSQNNLYIIGDYYSTTINVDGQIINSQGNNDVFLMKYDSSGNLIWVKSFGGLSYDYIGGIDFDSNDNIYITGYFGSNNFVLDTLDLSNNDYVGYNLYVAKIDSIGNIMWALSGVSDGSNFSTAITVSNLNEVYIAGSFHSSFLVFGQDTLFNDAWGNPNNDGFLAKLDFEQSLNIKNLNYSLQSLQVYPNPFHNQFIVNYELENATAQLLVFNIYGKQVSSKTISKTTTIVDITNQASGIYFVQITDGAKRIIQKLVKQ